MLGLTMYAEDHEGAYPYRLGGSGMIMNPHDHNVFIMKELNDIIFFNHSFNFTYQFIFALLFIKRMFFKYNRITFQPY